MKPVLREKESKTLEFNLIRERLAGMTVTPMGKEKALALMPSADEGIVKLLLKETGEGRLLSARERFSPPAVEDITHYLLRAEKGGALTGPELAEIQVFLKGVRRWKRFFQSGEKRDFYPLLADYVSDMDGYSFLIQELDKCLDQEGNLLDGASPLLSSLRRKQRALQEHIREKLDSYLKSRRFKRYLQEEIITIRSGRFVLPVKQAYRSQVEGVLHDQSSSGATLFIEPMPVVQLQNRLTSLMNEAEDEEERILRDLSMNTAGAAGLITKDLDIYGNLDFILARGRFSLDCRGTDPGITGQMEYGIRLEKARHPLLKEEVVPLDFELGKDSRVMVVTGPNTGGKTVALKTVGLMAAMAQSGLHLPAGRETKVPVFNSIRADIGDEQSIAQSLSTFSAHMKNIISILEDTGPSSLVLLDELGAGTDPSEGAALAMAILNRLSRAGALAVATTHINELKLFAQVTEGMQNAAMEFNHENLEPTYRLLQGIPGQSNAFSIAGRLGLPPEMLEEARSLLHREHEQVEEVIASLVEDQRRFSRDSNQAARDRARAAELSKELEAEREKLREKKEDIIREAREESRLMIKRAKVTVNELIRQMHRLKEEGETASLARAEQLRQELHALGREGKGHGDGKKVSFTPIETGKITPGMEVLVGSLQQTGEVLSVFGDEVLVQVGSMKVKVAPEDIRFKRGKQSKPLAAASSYTVTHSAPAAGDIHLRGMKVDEALPAVEKFLDEAILAGFNRVTLIHGKGTGKLKKALHDYLKDQPCVSSFRRGVPGEGGDGVTVVELIR